MKIETLSVFPNCYDSIMNESIMRIAQQKGILEFEAYDLRNWTHDKHRTTDDKPYGGGQGLLMKCEPVFEACDDIFKKYKQKPYVILMAPTGKVFSEDKTLELAQKNHLFFICGHYEGFDERIYTLADCVISLGDYIVSSGELASMVVIDAVVRRLDNVLGDECSNIDESFYDGLLEYPQYTRPATYRGMKVPDVLLSGNHANIAKWRRLQSIIRTYKIRPDLIKFAAITKKEKEFLKTIYSAEFNQ